MSSLRHARADSAVLPRFAQRHLARLIVQGLGTSASAGLMLFGTAAAQGQALTIPGGEQPYTFSVTGTTGGSPGGSEKKPLPGVTGGNLGTVTATQAAGLSVGATLPAIGLSVTGGTGGSGGQAEGGDSSVYGTGAYGGAGGTGGTPGLLTLSMSGGVTSASNGPAAIAVQSSGGTGGFGGSYAGTYGYSGVAGSGGQGGDIQFNLLSGGNFDSIVGWNKSTPGTTALLLQTTGGDGAQNDPSMGNSGSARQSSGDVTGRQGGNGGRGGNIAANLTVQDYVISAGSAIVAISQGGSGSPGSDASADIGGDVHGGTGGNGGDGGTVQMTVAGDRQHSIMAVGGPASATGATIPVSDDGTSTAQAAFIAAGIQLQSFGGQGSTGGSVNGTVTKGGNGGNAGNGGIVTLNYGGAGITTTGFAAAGVVAQSVGGSGGDGASAGGVMSKKGGNGGTGGNGAAVTLDFGDTLGASTSSIIQTAGDSSTAIVAQSIGGGGGYGGDVQVSSVLVGVGIGGSGEKGGTAGVVIVKNGEDVDNNGNATNQGILIQTLGAQSSAIVAQSIGGGGGVGGNASSTVFGPFSYAVGGSGGVGGAAGSRGTNQVTVANAGVIQTTGDHSMGIAAQAIGGGGGIGGAASALTASAQLNITIAVGGNGGTGGDAGDVAVVNDGQIITMGNDAWGVLAQSIGGGGGNGGGSKAFAIQAANSGEAPSLNLSVAVGGTGGTAGDGGNVTATSNFAIMTSGVGSHGINAQSVGGGGGNGGDSSSIQSNVMGSTFNYNMAIGGSGGKGGSGGSVEVTNNGLIWTLGWFSYGVLAQSIGGGGGNGGMGHTDTSSFHSAGTSKSGEFSMALGGSGASGNVGGSVTITNNAGVMTRGDLSRGLFAQSVGGGGGNGGAGTGKGTGGNVSVNVGIGGNGGSGNDGGSAFITNNGAIYTRGAESAAVYAQSIGGGGGTGGAGAAGGGTDPEVNFGNYLAKSTGLSPWLVNKGNGVYAWKDNTHGDFNAVDNFQSWASDYDGANSAATPPADGDGGGSFDVTLDVGVARGGKGGSGGAGGLVYVTNSGQIVTTGPASEGIFAQSVGGSGGDGGTTIASNNPTNGPKNLTTAISIGGGGGSAGAGGDVVIDNTGGSIVTAGDQSHGIFAQSIGGGGGSGGFTATGQGSVHDLSIQVGGDNGASGNGGGVDVYSVSGAQTAVPSTIVTAGDDAVGIVAQSIGGGGGNVAIMHTQQDPATGGAVSHSEQFGPSGFQGTLGYVAFAGSMSSIKCNNSYTVAACGDGGIVSVSSDTITTSGVNAYGVLAQSIGGGGGWINGITLTGNNFFGGFINGVAAQGDGGSVTVTINKLVATTGDGAIGVLAQSIGGAGLLAGDTATASEFGSSFNPPVVIGDSSKANIGNGGAVNVTVNAGSAITTAGRSAYGIFAQSVGGGGGLVTTQDLGTLMGSANGTGTAGAVTVNVNGSITTTGVNAAGVYVNSDGGSASANPVNVNVASSGSVRSAQGHAVLVNSSASSNTVTNNGTLMANAPASFAVIATDAALNIQNNGYIYGNVDTKGGTMRIDNNAATWGSWTITGISNVAKVISTSEIDVGVTAGNYYLNGDLQNSGTIVNPVDAVAGQAGLLKVSGQALLSQGTRILIRPQTLAPVAMPILSAGNLQIPVAPSVLGADGLAWTNAGAVNQMLYTLSTANNTLSVTPVTNIANAASSVSASTSEQAVAAHLDQGFVSTLSAAQGANYAALANYRDKGLFLTALDGLSNEATQSVGTARLSASHAFVERMNSCPQFQADGAELRERDCVWSRAIGNDVERSGSGGGSAVGYKQENYVMQIGGQRQIAPDWFLGGSAAYERSNTSATGISSSMHGEGGALGLVLKRQLGDWLVSGAVDAGWGQYDTERRIVLGNQVETAKGAFNAQHLGLHARVARQFAFEGWYLKPYLDLHATRIHTDSYAETGASTLGLKVSSERDDLFAASPMLEVGNRLRLGNGLALHSYVSAGTTYYSSNEWGANASFQGASSAAGSFRAVSSLPNQRTKVIVGTNLLLNKSLDLKLEYTGEFASGYRSNAASVKLNYLF